MLLDELEASFLYSREHGIAPAKSAASQTTMANYKLWLTPFYKFMEETRNRVRYEDITAADVRAYVQFVRQNPKWTRESTKLSMLRALRTLFRFVERDEECQNHVPPLRSWAGLLPPIPRNPRRDHIPTPRDLKAARNAWDVNKFFGFRNFVMYSLMLGTGMRIGEVCWLKVEHLQLDHSKLYVPEQGKTGSRLVPLEDDLVRLLKSWLKRRAKMRNGADSPWLFVARGGRRCGRNTLGQAFRKLQLGWEAKRITPHTLRHSFGTYYLRNGGELEKLRQITGHSSYESLKGYLHLAQVGGEAAKEELEKVSPLKMLNRSTKK